MKIRFKTKGILPHRFVRRNRRHARQHKELELPSTRCRCHLSSCGRHNALGSAGKACLSEQQKHSKPVVQMHAPGKLIGPEPASQPNETKVGMHPPTHGSIVTSAVSNFDACIARGVNLLVLVRTRREWNRGASVFIYIILVGQRLKPR